MTSQVLLPPGFQHLPLISAVAGLAAPRTPRLTPRSRQQGVPRPDMNPAAAADGFPGVQFSGAAAVLVELSADVHICGLCRSHFNNLDAFVAHKQSGCHLAGAGGGANTVQFVSAETVTPSQTAARTITSETQTITVSAPEFVFEHGYQTFLPSEGAAAQSGGIATK
ncbi:hypothetical protein GDO78_018769, partial [Eleutherodactylus coqui]